ncbi:sporulation control protein Spo0M [Chromobacterium phragmitis]|uniref:Sporulation control protein Spo0M n=1 Tax=Chromobacterium phragmitis TaxID=2202141 RepID=A0A344UJ10_9NEIS|nr:sporulation protein [Chromobacterium phragmitis]AXE29867.1 sporulation control protein Spo0M [Chromobacterium phragmitis]AXE35258.1 sporulation control protein Spo0M [Chromobacterium phragmitis]
MLKSLFAAAGIGGATVDTRLINPRLRPGEILRGEVVVKGGSVDQDISKIELLLLTETECEREGRETRETAWLAGLPISGPCRIPAGCEWRLPFQLPLPAETPVNHHPALRDEPPVWIHTDLALGMARDAADNDRLQVQPTPQMEAILRAFSRLGWELHRADVEAGTVRAGEAASTLGCYQEFELRPRDAGWNWNEIELTFIPDGYGAIHVLIEIDAGDDDHYLSLRMEPDWEDADWTAELRVRLGL